MFERFVTCRFFHSHLLDLADAEKILALQMGDTVSLAEPLRMIGKVFFRWDQLVKSVAKTEYCMMPAPFRGHALEMAVQFEPGSKLGVLPYHALVECLPAHKRRQ